MHATHRSVTRQSPAKQGDVLGYHPTTHVEGSVTEQTGLGSFDAQRGPTGGPSEAFVSHQQHTLDACPEGDWGGAGSGWGEAGGGGKGAAWGMSTTGMGGGPDEGVVDVEPLKCGWLRKRTSGGWGWRKRWFVLSQMNLCYYTDPNNLGVQKTLNFDGGRLHVAKGQEANELVVKCHERTLFLRASSQWEAAQWIMAFQLVMQAFGSDWMRSMPGTERAAHSAGTVGQRPMPWSGRGGPGGAAPACGWQGEDGVGKRKAALDSSGSEDVWRPSKIASPAPSREGTEHGESRDGSIRQGIRSLDNSGRLLSPDATGHGATIYSLDSSHRQASGQDWLRQEADARNRQMLEMAAGALQAWTLNDRNSPAPAGRSPSGSGTNITRPSSGPYSQEDYVAASSAAQTVISPGSGGAAAVSVPTGGSGGSVGGAVGGDAGGSPASGHVKHKIFPDIQREKFEFLPPAQRGTLARQINNQKNLSRVNPAVVKAGHQAVELSLRIIAHRLILRPAGPVTFSVSQVLKVAWSIFSRQLAEGKLRLMPVTSVHLTSVALKKIIRGHSSAGSDWPQVREDQGLASSQQTSKCAGDLICELFPFVDMAQEADLLPPILLPLVTLVDHFESNGWPAPMDLDSMDLSVHSEAEG